MGRSRGGLPIELKLTEEQAHDGRSAADILDSLGEGCILLGDRVYDSDAMRATLAERGAWARVKPMPIWGAHPGFQPVPLSLSQSGRALLQQTQAFQNCRNPLQQTRRQLPRLSPTRFHQDLVATK
jgi:transposase